MNLTQNGKPDKTIGGLNGRWAWLFRFALATYPLLIAWAIWVTANTQEIKHAAVQAEQNKILLQEVREEQLRSAYTSAEVGAMKREIVALQIVVERLRTLIEDRRE